MDEIQATQLSSSLSYPPWILLEPYIDVDTTGSYSSTDTDPNTLVVARTSRGHPIGVSLSLASPPAESRVCIHLPEGSNPGNHENHVIAAHGDSVLIQVASEPGFDMPQDYFIYNAGTAASSNSPSSSCRQPPSLSLLPPSNGYQDTDSTGILRRGESDFVVAQLGMIRRKNDDDETMPNKEQHVAEILLFRSGEWWTARWSRIPGLGADEIQSCAGCAWAKGSFSAGTCSTRGSGYGMCPSLTTHDAARITLQAGTVCVTSGGGGDAVKFVNTFARCCCGGDGATECKHSKNCYLIKTWTLRMDSMTWVVDATELWALDAYKSLPRVQPSFPVVSMDEPHVICFMLQQEMQWWLIAVDARNKTLRSVCSYEKPHQFEYTYPGNFFLPSKVSYYLNSCPGSSSSSSQIDIIEPPSLSIRNEEKTSNAKPGCKTTSADPGSSMHASEILEALQEISSYDMPGDDTRKAISILSRGNGRRFRSYLGIPKNLRQDWLLMEINARSS
ncbi:hypothetical protein PR202_ga25166 [Eleusine coracana subsp. coracana]|uniref:DUF1618 domain-containing protein n=1 Tax=Eleusine coracana subsp. coracana TaxID=191504 RepID=A0AAV5DAN4_ELECO|nr:hypothetical protein PR202_ga25166 [Eleusine coracana subsp. coracana]